MKKDSFYIQIDSPFISEAMQKIAFENGYSWKPETTPKFLNAKYIAFNYYCPKDMVWSDREQDLRNTTRLSLEEAIKRLQPNDIIIEGHKVEFLSDNDVIKIGCKIISKDTIKKIVEVIDNNGIQIDGEHVKFMFLDKMIKVGDYKVKFDQVKEVYARLLKQ